FKNSYLIHGLSSSFYIIRPRPLITPLFPYTTLFRSLELAEFGRRVLRHRVRVVQLGELEVRQLHLARVRLVVDRQHLEVVLLLEDRKSTRLNSSHVAISYAVFCLKKKIL